MENQLAPVNLVVLYCPVEIFGFSFNPCAKLDGHGGTWTGCWVNSCTTSFYTFPIAQSYLSIIHEPFSIGAYLSLLKKNRLKKIMIHDYTIL